MLHGRLQAGGASLLLLECGFEGGLGWWRLEQDFLMCVCVCVLVRVCACACVCVCVRVRARMLACTTWMPSSMLGNSCFLSDRASSAALISVQSLNAETSRVACADCLAQAGLLACADCLDQAGLLVQIVWLRQDCMQC